MQLSEELRLDPLELALNGGEDFELLFTIHPRDLARLPKHVGGVPATYIGDVTYEGNGILLCKGAGFRVLQPRGFTHFY
jgi:thiamine-monophosphate kinase